MPREILVHLNIEMPDHVPLTADDLGREVLAALSVGTDPEHTPALAESTVHVALVDEI